MLKHSSNPLAKGQLLMQLHATFGDFCWLCCASCKNGGVTPVPESASGIFKKHQSCEETSFGPVLPVLHFKEPSLQSHTIFW